MFRPFLPYGMCAAAAAFLAYLLTRPMDLSTMYQLVLMAAVLVFPLLLRWHYPLLLVSFAMPVSIFFLQGQPPLWMLMTMISLSIVLVERAIKGKQQFVHVPQIILPLLVILFVVFMTAELTGGLGFRALGSDIFGGKKYACIFAGILAYFAVTSRPIPPEKARVYTALLLLGSLPAFVADLAAVLPHGLQFIFLFISPGEAGLDEMGNYTNFELGVSRMGGFSSAAMALYLWLLARHGVRGIFSAKTPWRLIGVFITFTIIGLGGFRSLIIQAMLIFMLLFFMEKLHRTPLVFVFMLGGVLLLTILLPFASKLPFVIQRSLAFLPLPLTPEAVNSAQDSSNWRINMWTSLMQEVPRHLWLGKGFAIPVETFNEMMGGSVMADTVEQMDGSQQALALSGDYHNGPLSVIIPFGIWGVIGFVWFLWAAFSVLYRNYKFGDPANLLVNRFLLVLLLVKLVIFLTVFGAFQSDLGTFALYVGFSIALNHGVCREGANHLSLQPGRQGVFAVKRPGPPSQLQPSGF